MWNAAIVALLVLITMGGIREGLRLSLLREADEQLVEDSREVQLVFERMYPNENEVQAELNLKAITHTHRGLYIRIFDDRKQLRWTSRNAPNVLFPLRILDNIGRPFSYHEYRIMQFKPVKSKVPGWTIRVATSFAPLEAEVRRLTHLMIWVGCGAMVLALVGGYWLARRATRPIAEIIRTTNQLRPHKLIDRLPIRGTGDELDKLSITINGFLDRIAKYISESREFTANAAHELRSPLAAIQSAIEVTLESDRTLEEYKELACDILEQCNDLRTLVNQLLLLAETDVGIWQIPPEPFDLSLTVCRAVEMFQGVAETRNMKLIWDGEMGISIPGDQGRIRQVINNLVDNAMKFSADGTTVTISLSRDLAKQEAVFQVTDSGSGISESDHQHLFERFFRGDRARRRDTATKGSGLGLSICHGIVRAHRGTIEAANNECQGCTFKIGRAHV